MTRPAKLSMYKSAMALILTAIGLTAIKPSTAAAAVQCWGAYLTYAQAQAALTQARANGICVDPNLDPQQAYFEVVGGPSASGVWVYWGCCNTYTSILPQSDESLSLEQEQADRADE